MPNYCDYTIKIVGRRASCYEFLSRMKDYDRPNHFWRMFEAYDENVDVKPLLGTCSMVIRGYCAWSLESCCRASGYSEGVDLFAVNTKELDLKLEAYSSEEGCGFEEHYIYDHGECLIDECLDTEIFWWDKSAFPSYEAYKVEHPTAPPECYFERGDGDTAIIGGFGDNYEHWHI